MIPPWLLFVAIICLGLVLTWYFLVLPLAVRITITWLWLPLVEAVMPWPGYRLHYDRHLLQAKLHQTHEVIDQWRLVENYLEQHAQDQALWLLIIDRQLLAQHGQQAALQLALISAKQPENIEWQLREVLLQLINHDTNLTTSTLWQQLSQHHPQHLAVVAIERYLSHQPLSDSLPISSSTEDISMEQYDLQLVLQLLGNRAETE